MNFWSSFAEKHPSAATWIREGGLFVIVSNVITVFKYLMLTFLPAAFAFLGDASFGWPGIPVTLSSGTSWAMTRRTAALPTSAPTWSPW